MKAWPWALGVVALAGAAWWWRREGEPVTEETSNAEAATGGGATVYVKGGVDLSELHPELSAFLAWWRENGPFNVKVTAAGRTDAEQAAFYAQGRTSAGGIITNARTARESAHGRRRLSDGRVVACALDIYPANTSNNIELNYLDPRWLVLVGAAAARGLVSLGKTALGDWPHLEIEGWEALPYVG